MADDNDLTAEHRAFLRELVKSVPAGDIATLVKIIKAYETWQSWGLLGRAIIWIVLTLAALVVAISTISQAKWPGS